MKKTICLWALLLIVVSCTNDDNYNDEHGDKAVIPPKGRIIRIMTYNIYGARATSPANAADLDALAEVIRRQDPDFVTLNEVDVFTNRTGKDVHQARDLANSVWSGTSRKPSTATEANTATPCCRNTRL